MRSGPESEMCNQYDCQGVAYFKSLWKGEVNLRDTMFQDLAVHEKDFLSAFGS